MPAREDQKLARGRGFISDRSLGFHLGESNGLEGVEDVAHRRLKKGCAALTCPRKNYEKRESLFAIRNDFRKSSNGNRSLETTARDFG